LIRSGEPYSVDLRGRVIAEVEDGASRREAAELWAQPERGGDLDAALVFDFEGGLD
jgi:hypothetical protein